MKEENLTKIVGLAVNDYEMMGEGDDVVAGLSGGVDSIALVCLLAARLKRIPVKYRIHPVLIDLHAGGSAEHSRNIEALTVFLRERTGLETEVINLPVTGYLVDESGRPKIKNTCFKCAQIRRSELIKYADAHGYKKIALGHHKDDVVETILMNLFYKRETSAMMPRLPLFDGKFEIVRPMVYLDKKQIRRYVEEIGAPVVPEVCPAKLSGKELRREKVREILASLEREIPGVKNNIFASLRNPQRDYMLDRFFNPKRSGLYKRP